MSQDPINPQPPKSGGGGLMWVIIIVVVLLLICGGICAGIVIVTNRGLSAMGKAATQFAELAEPSTAAENELRASEVVKEKFGDNLTFGFASREGSTEGELNTADARFKFDVMGTQKGTAHIRAARLEGLWKINEIKIDMPDGTQLDVPVSGEAALPDLKFDFDMPEEDAAK